MLSDVYRCSYNGFENISMINLQKCKIKWYDYKGLNYKIHFDAESRYYYAVLQPDFEQIHTWKAEIKVSTKYIKNILQDNSVQRDTGWSQLTRPLHRRIKYKEESCI
jgi:hypothetical protein